MENDSLIENSHQIEKITRFFKPKSIAVIGGREAEKVINQSRALGYLGEIHAVNPNRPKLANVDCLASINDLPKDIDAAFIAIPNHATIEAVKQLNAINCAGCVCYASGFAEHNHRGKSLQDDLIKASENMALVGPNCYGMINYIDKYALWPDYHGGNAVEKGAVIITQSGNIGINFTMQKRGLPLAMLVSTGNQAGLGIADYIRYFATHPHVTVIGIHIESILNIDAFQQASLFAQAHNKSIVCLKSGKSSLGADALKSHTSAIAGEHHFYQALLDGLNIATVNSLDVFIETLKIHHVFGPLPKASMLSISSSGGEASLCADLASQYQVEMPKLSDDLCNELTEVLGDVVIIQNPLDYHTFIWGDYEKQKECFGIAHKGEQSITCKILDFPPLENPLSKDWITTVDAFIASTQSKSKQSSKAAAVISSFSDNMPASIQQKCLQNNIVPLSGLDHAIAAIYSSAAAFVDGEKRVSHYKSLLLQPTKHSIDYTKVVNLDESQSKAILEDLGLNIAKSFTLSKEEDLESKLKTTEVIYPLVAKILDANILHKSELNGVILNINDENALNTAVSKLQGMSDTILIEEMITDNVCELLLRVKFDSQFGAVLSIGLGGKFIEVLNDLVHIILPTNDEEIREKLSQLKGQKIIHGYRNVRGIDIDRLIELIILMQDKLQALFERKAKAAEGDFEMTEIEVNPLIATHSNFIVADAIVSLYPSKSISR